MMQHITCRLCMVVLGNRVLTCLMPVHLLVEQVKLQPMQVGCRVIGSWLAGCARMCMLSM